MDSTYKYTTELASSIDAALASGKLSAWQTKFLRDISAKIQQYGNRTRLSEMQLAKVKEALSRASIKGPDSAETADPQSAAESIQHTSNRRNSPPKASAPKSPQRKRRAGSSGSRQARTVRRALGLPSPLVLGSVAVMVLYLALFGGDDSYDPAPQASWQPASTTPTTYSQSTRSGVTKYPRPSERKTTAQLPDTSPTSPTPARSVAFRNASPPSVAKAPPPTPATRKIRRPPNFSVTDGDTVKVYGDAKGTRLVGFNAPETWKPRCEYERQLGEQATRRLNELVTNGNAVLTKVACACAPGTQGTRRCNYGRSCGVLRVDGLDVGDILIREGLAVPFRCGSTRCPRTPRPWC